MVKGIKSSRRCCWVAMCLLFIFSFIAGRSAHAEAERQDLVRVAEFARVLEDPSGEMAFSQAQAALAQDRFEGPRGKLEFGYTSSVYWIYFKVQNPKAQSEDYYLNSSYALIDSIEVYESGPGGFSKTTLGDARPYTARAIDTVSFSHKMRIAAGQTKEIYLRVYSTSSLSLPLRLLDADSFVEYMHDQMLMLGVFYGIILGLFAYNLFLFLMTRERVYVTYLLFVSFSAAFSASLDGTTYRLYPEMVGWQQVSTYVYIAGAAFFALRFAKDCLETKKYLPKTHKLILVLEYLFLGLGLLCVVFPCRQTSIGTVLSLNFVLGLLSFSAFVRVVHGDKSAKVFAIAWLVMIVSVGVGILTATGVLPFQELLPITHKLGVSCEMVLLSMGLANRINILKDAEKQAKSEASEATAAVQAKSAFLAKMSHEIRTPMNGVLGMTELLSQTKLTTQQEGCVQTIYGSGRALLCIINDILDYSKLEAGKVELEAEPFDLEHLLDDCASLFALNAADKGIPLLVRCELEMGCELIGDSNRIRQILVNLLSNAYKFTEQGQIEMAVKPGPKSGQVMFSVADSGLGISKSAQAKLFESFSQEDSSITRKFGGTGLGLAICRQLVQVMGGEIGVQSKKGEGSRFWFCIPLKVSERDTAELEETKVIPIRGRRCFFLGERDAQGRRLADLAKELCGDVACAQNEAELELLAQEIGKPDFVLVHGRGLELRHAKQAIAKSRTWGAHVLLSVSARQSDIRDLTANEAGAEVLEQPLTRRKLRQTLHSCLAGYSKTLVSAVSRQKETSGLALRFTDLRVLAAEDNMVNQKVLQGMLHRLGLTAQFVKNGRQAVQAVQEAPAPFDLILMDCEMPEMDGYTATREIRRFEAKKGQRAVIIALSAHVLAEHRERGLASGMDDFLFKPISLNLISQALKSHFEVSKKVA